MEWLNVAFWMIGTLIVMLGPIILIHELGHFAAAKLLGVRVEEFGLGFPPRILRLWREKGYVELDGVRIMLPKRFALPSGLRVGASVRVLSRRDADGTLVLRRIKLADAEAEQHTEDRTVDERDVKLSGELTALEPGTLYSLNLLPMGAFVKMTGEEDPSDPRSLAAQPKRHRIAVLAAGAALNILAAGIILASAYLSGVPRDWLVRITSVQPDTAAQEAGLLDGDVIEAVNGQRLQDGMIELHEVILDSPGERVEFTIQRGGQRVTLYATPRRNEQGDGVLGIVMQAWPDRRTLETYSLSGAFRAGVSDVGRIVATIVRLPTLIARGEVSPEEARPSSMVGIGSLLAFSLQQSVAWGLAFPALQTAGLISLALGLTNLLPLPALDGGRILFVLLEAIRGKRISPEREAMIHFVTLVVLVALMFVLMFQDIVNPIIPWSWLK
jgi:regulator of sigma E protease